MEDLDVWAYSGVRRLPAVAANRETESKRQKVAADVEIVTDVARMGRGGEIRTRQTSLLSFFAQTEPKIRVSERPDAQVIQKVAYSEISDAQAVESYKTRKGEAKKCPFYKFAGDCPYVVDAFSYGYVDKVDGYFLSHFHSDHYKGLTKNFNQPIYCGKITANLLQHVLKVSPANLHPLPLDEFISLPDGSEVLLTDANHCPGAVMFVFRQRNGVVHVHSGDLRADREKIAIPTLWHRFRVNTLYLDTTYMDPTYRFPAQSEIIAETLRFVREETKRRHRLLICVGTYTIGKERIFAAIAEMLDCKIFVEKHKMEILRCLDDETLERRLTLNPDATNLHVVTMAALTFARLDEYLRRTTYDSVLGIKPTGWEFDKKSKKCGSICVNSRKSITIAGIPYSEHSSFDELKNFVKVVRPKRILPTVNCGDAAKRKSMQDYFAQWLNSQ